MQIYAFHKLLIPQSNFNYPYLVLIPKFHKSPVKFRTVTVDCNTYSNNANKILLNILKQIYDLTLKTNNTYCLKNSYQLIECLNKIKNLESQLSEHLIAIRHLNKVETARNSIYKQNKSNIRNNLEFSSKITINAIDIISSDDHK